MFPANLSLQILPAIPEDRIYEVVDKVIQVIDSSGLKYIVGPMETTIEGDLKSLLNLVEKTQQICIAEGASRVFSVIKIDYRPGGVSIDEKMVNYR